MAKINFRTFYSSKVLQTIRIDGFSGVALVLGGVRVKIQGNDIICSLVTEPFTYKDLWAPMYFVFEKEF
ncbi:MAG: hypothetical protein LBJ31_10680 [Treponema sp.]|nr:hypothetical protein [Treponema sp.]